MIDTIKQIGKWVLILLIVLVLWNVSKKWLTPTIITALGGYTEKSYTEKIDTVGIQVDSVWYGSTGDNKRIDSLIAIVKTIGNRKVINNYTTLVSTTDTTSSTSINGKLLQPKTTTKDSTFLQVYSTENDISDTLINGKIKTIVNSIDCKIVSQSLEYKPKFPIFITKTISIEKTKESVLSNKDKSKIGIGSTFTLDKQIGIQGAYLNTQNWQFQGGLLYDLNNTNNKTATISVFKFF